MSILYVGIDLANNVFAVHPSVARGKLHARADRRTATVHGGDGSVLGRAPLGEAVRAARAHGEADGTQVRRTVPHGRRARYDELRQLRERRS